MHQPSPAFRRAAARIAFAALCFGVAPYWQQACRFFSSAASVFRPIVLAAVIAFAIALAVAGAGYLIYRAVCRRHEQNGHKETPGG